MTPPVYWALLNWGTFHPQREQRANTTGSFSPTYSEANYGSLPAGRVAEEELLDNQAATEFHYLDPS